MALALCLVRMTKRLTPDQIRVEQAASREAGCSSLSGKLHRERRASHKRASAEDLQNLPRLHRPLPSYTFWLPWSRRTTLWTVLRIFPGVALRKLSLFNVIRVGADLLFKDLLFSVARLNRPGLSSYFRGLG